MSFARGLAVSFVSCALLVVTFLFWWPLLVYVWNYWF